MNFEHTAVVEGDPPEVFGLTQDYSRRLTWDPFLRRAELVGGAPAAGVGVRAWCVSRAGLGMETEYVSFVPPRIAAVRMTRGPRLLESFGGAWEFKSAGDGATAVSFRYQFRMRPRWLAWALEPLARRWFSWETRKRVVALQAALRKGRAGGPVTRVPQPTPSVNEHDVERVLRRDYPAVAVEEILACIETVEVREKPRVVLACLKIARGDVDRLRNELANAGGYYREILSEAEYPLATRRWSRIGSLPEAEVRAIYDQDWRQYSEWLKRP